jgi:DNA replication protein DnaC
MTARQAADGAARAIGSASRPAPKTSTTTSRVRTRPRPSQKAAESQWIDAADNLALVGPSGVWKSWLPCAIGQKDCRDGRSIVYHR